jgi:hypothetical protein
LIRHNLSAIVVTVIAQIRHRVDKERIGRVVSTAGIGGVRTVLGLIGHIALILSIVLGRDGLSRSPQRLGNVILRIAIGGQIVLNGRLYYLSVDR